MVEANIGTIFEFVGSLIVFGFIFILVYIIADTWYLCRKQLALLYEIISIIDEDTDEDADEKDLESSDG